MKAYKLPDYSATFIRSIRAKAKELYPDMTSISHIRPRCYCVGKPAKHCAVLAVPDSDSEPQVLDQKTILVQNPSASYVESGEWCISAYVMRPGNGQPVVLPYP